VSLSQLAFYLWARRSAAALVYGQELLKLGRTEQVRMLAARYREGPYRLVSDYLTVRYELSTGRIGHGSERAKSTLLGLDALGHGAEVWFADCLLTRMWSVAFELGVAKPRDMDAVLERFLLAEPHRMGSCGFEALYLPYAATYASKEVGARAIERIRELFGEGQLKLMPHADALLEGAERYIAGDYAAAVERWRPTIRAEAVSTAYVRIDAFDRADEEALASQLDRAAIDRYGAVTLAAHAREARRAAARGDAAMARKLARQCIDAWADADVKIAAVDEMRELLAQLDGSR
ncbi:MAG: hypothetical protein JRI23_19290, partial [Deltaproteobacteria bacterium]|jgi:hypothetical protein|nr:hypothetical protein [Deltaproteobacteria bacterium]MBW2534009.1 hypothetical protein [Deltaproteobacteria bacterium]